MYDNCTKKQRDFLKILQENTGLEEKCQEITSIILHLFYKIVTMIKYLPKYGINFNRLLHTEKKKESGVKTK